MAKPINKDGKVYRMRRGKLVEIPAEWVGQVTSRQTINARASKQPHKMRKLIKHGSTNRAGAQRRSDKRERGE